MPLAVCLTGSNQDLKEAVDRHRQPQTLGTWVEQGGWGLGLQGSMYRGRFGEEDWWV